MRSHVQIMIFACIAPLFTSNCAAFGQPSLSGSTDVERLIQQLQNGSNAEQLNACEKLAELGPYASSAVVALTSKLKAEDLAVAYESLIALGNIGPMASNAADSIANVARANGPLQATAIDSLRKVGVVPPDMVAALNELTGSSDDSVAVAAIRCVNAVQASSTIDPGLVPRLTSTLANKRNSVRSEAVATLSEIGNPAVSDLGKVLDEGDDLSLIAASQAIAAIGHDASNLAPRLLKLLSRENIVVVRQAVLALGSINADPEQTLPQLGKLLASTDAALRADACTAIGGFDERAANLIPAIARLLQEDDSVIVRIAAADVLGRIGKENNVAANALVKAIADSSGSVTVHAANSLSQLGKVAIGPLSQMLQNKDYARLAAGLLAEMGPDAKPAVPKLIGLLNSKDQTIRREAFIALAALGDDATEAVATLRDILQYSDREESRAGAAYVLGKIGDRGSVEDLKKILANPKQHDSKLSRAAAWALVTLQPDTDIAAVAIPIFVKALDSEEPIARREAIAALATLGPSEASMTTKLIQVARNDPDTSVQAEALHALAVLGASGDEVLALAIASLNSDIPDVRNSATFLIGSIGPAAKSVASSLRTRARTGMEFDRMVAAWGLIRVENSAENAAIVLPLMLKALSEQNPRTQVEATRTLAMLGIKDESVLQGLDALSRSQNDEVRQVAEEARNLLLATP